MSCSSHQSRNLISLDVRASLFVLKMKIFQSGFGAKEQSMVDKDSIPRTFFVTLQYQPAQ